jgi:bisphosphoglycerate-independent phosphoglycerate mutase (AlkP superfamily)
LEYDKSIKNIDDGLGILLKGLNIFEIKPEIIISGDHGWNSLSKNHNLSDKDTLTVNLVTNNYILIGKNEEKKQCDIAPTILNYFGMNSSQYSDITELGCKSLIQTQ